MNTITMSDSSEDERQTNVVKLPALTSFKDLRLDWAPIVSCADENRVRTILENKAGAHAAKIEAEMKARIAHLRDYALPAKQAKHDRLLAELKALPEYRETTKRTMAWPKGFLPRLEVLGLLATGTTVFLIGWHNSSQLILDYVQDVITSYTLTAPLLLLPPATHVANKTLRISPRWVTAILGSVGIVGGGLLVWTLVGGGTPPADGGSDWSKYFVAAVDKGHLLLAQALIECSLGTILISHAESLLTTEFPAQANNPDVISCRSNLESAIGEMGVATDEIASLEGTISQLGKSQTAWVEAQVATWQGLR